jgi:aerobic-type carbon monoxide dehydrogenase small subunit (CoxS/CutS family)
VNEILRTATITVEVNGQPHERSVPVRLTAADFLRDVLAMRGTRVGCEQGVCGACTILLEGTSVRSCLLFAVQLDGRAVTTVEGLTDDPGQLHPLQESFRRCHALQCGFCTAGFLLTAHEFLNETSGASEDQIREAISGNICRCTGYEGIVEAVRDADQTWDR